MFGLVVRFDLRPDAGSEFDGLVDRTVAQILVSEPETLIYAIHRIEGDDNARVFYEVYSDRAAFDSHENQPYVKDFLERRRRHLVSEPRVECLTSFGGNGLPSSS